MKQINTWLFNHIQIIVIWFLLLGAFFDCLTALSLHILHISFTGIMVLKVLFLGLLIYDLFFVSKCRYKIIKIMITMIICYMFLFIMQTIIQKGTDVFFYECQAMIRTFFFPITLLCLYNLQLEKRFIVDVKYLYFILFSYLILILIPLITNTGFDSYEITKVGTIGWFHSCNEVGGILSILFPIVLAKLLKINKWLSIFCITILLYVYSSIGTKVPLLSIFLTFLLLGGSCFFSLFHYKKWKQISYLAITVFVGIIILILFIPKTSFYKNIQIHLKFLEIDSISDLLTIQKIDHFIFSERVKFLGNTRNNYEKSPMIQKILGIGYIENYATDQVNTKLIEMDYYDIFFRHGIVGSAVYFTPYIWILSKIVNQMKRKTNFPILVSILFIIILSLFSGHILTAPSVSIIVSYILLLSLKEAVNYES